MITIALLIGMEITQRVKLRYYPKSTKDHDRSVLLYKGNSGVLSQLRSFSHVDYVGSPPDSRGN